MKLLAILLSLCASLSIVVANSQTYIKPSKKMLDEYELDQLIKINLERARNGYPKIEYNLNLMDSAQYAANQLARFGELHPPYFRTCNKYVGQAFRYQGYLQSAKKFFGSKICFNNLSPYIDTFIYDVLYDCSLKYVKIFDYDEYGYASSFDKEGNAYLVKLFTLRNSNNGAGIGSTGPVTDNEKNQTNNGFGSANPFGRTLNSTEKQKNESFVFDLNKSSTPTRPKIVARINGEERSNFQVEFFNKLKKLKSFKKFD